MAYHTQQRKETQKRRRKNRYQPFARQASGWTAKRRRVRIRAAIGYNGCYSVLFWSKRNRFEIAGTVLLLRTYQTSYSAWPTAAQDGGCGQHLRPHWWFRQRVERQSATFPSR